MGRFVPFVSIVVVVWSRLAFAETSSDIVAHGVELRRKGVGLWVEAEYDLFQSFAQRGKPLIKRTPA